MYILKTYSVANNSLLRPAVRFLWTWQGEALNGCPCHPLGTRNRQWCRAGWPTLGRSLVHTSRCTGERRWTSNSRQTPLYTGQSRRSDIVRAHTHPLCCCRFLFWTTTPATKSTITRQAQKAAPNIIQACDTAESCDFRRAAISWTPFSASASVRDLFANGSCSSILSGYSSTLLVDFQRRVRLLQFVQLNSLRRIWSPVIQRDSLYGMKFSQFKT